MGKFAQYKWSINFIKIWAIVPSRVGLGQGIREKLYAKYFIPISLPFYSNLKVSCSDQVGFDWQWNREKLISGLWLWPCGLQASVLRYIQPNLCGPFDIELHVIICFLLFIQSCALWFDFYLKMYSNFWHIHVCLGYGLYSALGGLANQSSPATLSFSFLSSPLGDIGAKLCGQSDHTLILMLRCLYKNVFVFNLSLRRCFCLRLFCPCMYSCAGWPRSIKGIVPQSISYRLINLIFWIVMGCGIARFGWRGLKTTQTWKFWSQNRGPIWLPGTSRHGAKW